MLRLPSPCLVVLAGPSGSGKTTWAGEWLGSDKVVSADRLRAVVGSGEDDLSASKDAFELLDQIVDRRLGRGLTTVVDTLGFDTDQRAAWRAIAHRQGVPCFAITFDVDPADARRRNKDRSKRVADSILTGQLRRWPGARAEITSEPFAAVHPAQPVELVPANLAAAAANSDARPSLRFGLQIPAFQFPGGPPVFAERLSAIARAAEEAGFDHIWTMDHFRQMPQWAPVWHDMPESYTTLSYLAAATTRIRLGVLVTGVTYRNLAHLGKIIATLDVLSGGRTICGLGAAWYKDEHVAYGWEFPSVEQRYAMLEDALQLLPLLWGPGAPRFEGRTVTVSEAMCYPRPLQEHIPLWVGGSGVRRTLRLVAQYADACNLFGEASQVRDKIAWLHRHCDEVGRARDDVEVTQLSTVLVAGARAELDGLIAALRPPRANAEKFARGVNAGTVEQHVGRFTQLAEAGVQTAVVSFPDLDRLDGVAAVERFVPIIDHFRSPRP